MLDPEQLDADAVLSALSNIGRSKEWVCADHMETHLMMEDRSTGEIWCDQCNSQKRPRPDVGIGGASYSYPDNIRRLGRLADRK